MHLKSVRSETKVGSVDNDLKSESLLSKSDSELPSKAINQIKYIAQEEKTNPEVHTDIKAEYKIKCLEKQLEKFK